MKSHVNYAVVLFALYAAGVVLLYFYFDFLTNEKYIETFWALLYG